LTRLMSSIARALSNIRQSWVVSGITTTIIAICLFLVGGYTLLIYNMDRVLDDLKGDMQITVYLRDGFPQSDINTLQDYLTGLTQVKSVTYTSKSDALEEFRTMLGDDERFLEGMKETPLPASLRITPKLEFRSSEGIYSILAQIEDGPLVEDIQYGEDWLSKLEKVLVVLNSGALLLGAILSLAAIFIISNTIKLTVLARRDELEIMRLVGATETFIRTPFFIEGLIQGLSGALLSLGLLVLLHRFAVTNFTSSIMELVGISSLKFLSGNMMLAIILTGMVLGGIGSLASVGRFSK